MSFADNTVNEFLEKLGSKSATPGGGGAAALAGASAAGLVTMVGRLTAGRPAFAAIEERVQAIISEGDKLRAELIAAIDGDAAAYGAVMAAYGMPKATDEEKAARTAVLQPALKGATDSPLQIARNCATICEMGAELAEAGNPQTITDAATAASLAEAAVQGATMQARINLKAIKDSGYIATARAEIEQILARVAAARERAFAAVNAKL